MRLAWKHGGSEHRVSSCNLGHKNNMAFYFCRYFENEQVLSKISKSGVPRLGTMHPKPQTLKMSLRAEDSQAASRRNCCKTHFARQGRCFRIVVCFIWYSCLGRHSKSCLMQRTDARGPPEKSEIPEVAPGLQPTVQPVEHLLPPAPNTSLHADAANEQDTRSGEDKGPKRRRAAMTQSLRWD